MMTVLLISAVILAAHTAWAADTGGGNTMALGVHEQRELPLPGTLERVAVADPAIADVVVLRGSGTRKGSVLVVGKKAGMTQVSVWPRGGAPVQWRIRVMGELQGALGETADVDVRGNAAVVSGHSASVLEHNERAQAAQQAAQQAGGAAGVVLDRSTVGQTGVVQVDVKVVEVNRNALKQIGVDFALSERSNTFSYGVASALSPRLGNAFTLTGSLTRGVFNMSAAINLLQSNGMGRVLAEPTLVALSGQSASFLAGGELPIPQSGGLGTTTIVYKPFGIGLTLTPTVLSPERIALKVAPEASDIDFTNTVTISGTVIPSIVTRRADTTVELGDGESFVIGGLVSRTTTAAVSKVPLLGDLPIIGAFFRNLKYTQQEKELVIVVTPHLVKPIAKGVKLPLPGDAREQRNGPVWGAYLMGVASDSELPGFSK
ncbi:pilus assembly protein N-terminal domain-containing protein [Pandoraea terrae]